MNIQQFVFKTSFKLFVKNTNLTRMLRKIQVSGTILLKKKYEVKSLTNIASTLCGYGRIFSTENKELIATERCLLHERIEP